MGDSTLRDNRTPGTTGVLSGLGDSTAIVPKAPDQLPGRRQPSLVITPGEDHRDVLGFPVGREQPSVIKIRSCCGTWQALGETKERHPLHHHEVHSRESAVHDTVV